MTRKTTPMLLAAIVLASILFSSFAFAQQTKCGNDVCDPEEKQWGGCPEDCSSPDGQLGVGNVQIKTGNTPPNDLSLPIVFGVILVVLLVIAGYAANARGRPTDYWRKRHGRSLKKRSKR